MKKSRFSITDDDDKLLENLWRWKILTTSMIHSSVYAHRTPSACYQRLVILENNNYIESFCSKDGKRWFWQLTNKGYKTLNLDEQQLSQVGFKSEFKDHDFLVTLLHFGIWQSFSNKSNAIYTEQELRRIELEKYPDWVPDTKQHRPDGYFKSDLALSNDKALIAIEVELNLKSVQAYMDLGSFYTDILGIHQVIWLVRSETDAKFIQRNLAKGSSRTAVEHSFILFDQWAQKLWQTEIYIGKNQTQKLENLFNSNALPLPYRSLGMEYFNFQKKLTNSISLNHLKKPAALRIKMIGY